MKALAKDTAFDDFEDDASLGGTKRVRLIVDVEGYEGPLDLLLDLARDQKIDLSAISILDLAEQYLVFIEEVQQSNLIVAADYLVMAAWLTYLKSRFLVPQKQADDEPDGEMLAEALARRLRRLQALRQAAEKLFEGPQLAQHRFARGFEQKITVETEHEYEVTLFDLLAAYGARRGIEERKKVTFRRPPVVDIAEVREILDRLLGEISGWVPLTTLIALIPVEPAKRRSLLASSFVAILELCKDGGLNLSQEATLAPLYLKPSRRRRDAEPRQIAS